jgi:hypothetical protein
VNIECEEIPGKNGIGKFNGFAFIIEQKQPNKVTGQEKQD